MTHRFKDAHPSLAARFSALNEAIEAGLLKKAVKLHQTLLKDIDAARTPPASSAPPSNMPAEAESQLKA